MNLREKTLSALERYLNEYGHLTVLLYGKSGSGKSYFAREFCKRFNKIKFLLGPEVGKESAFYLKSPLYEAVVIDEIHSVKEKFAETLYEELNNPRNGLVLFGTTTNPWLMPEAFRNRFCFQINMEYINKDLLDSPLNLRQQRNLKKMLKVVEEPAEALFYLDMDENGLDSIQRKYLQIVMEKQPVSLSVIAGILRLKDREVRNLESDLIEKDIIEITTKGRIIKNWPDYLR